MIAQQMGGVPPEAAQEPTPQEPMPQESGQEEQDPRMITQAAKDGIAQNTPGNIRSAMERFVTAGMRVMYDPKSHEMLLGELEKFPGPPAKQLAMGTAQLMALLVEKAKGPFPPEALVPASVILLMEIIGFMGEAGKMKVTNEVVAESTHKLMQLMATKLGAKPDGQSQETEPAPGEIPGGVSPSTRQTDPQPAPGAAPGLIQGAR